MMMTIVLKRVFTLVPEVSCPVFLKQGYKQIFKHKTQVISRADIGRRDSLVPTPVPNELIDQRLLEKPLPSAPDGFKPNSCIRRMYRSPTPPPVSLS